MGGPREAAARRVGRGRAALAFFGRAPVVMLVFFRGSMALSEPRHAEVTQSRRRLGGGVDPGLHMGFPWREREPPARIA